MQLAVIEFSRNVLGLKDAHTLEVNPSSKNLVITIMDDQIDKVKNKKMGGTMRLGAYPAILKKGSLAEKAYFGNSKTAQAQGNKIEERHRHRYEVNNDYVEKLENKGMVFSGKSPDGKLCEIVELPLDKHPFFMAAQFHPEFLARPLSPHPMFTTFCKACVNRKNK
jgi:CTP synthase